MNRPGRQIPKCIAMTCSAIIFALMAGISCAVPVTSLNRVEASRAYGLGGAVSALGADGSLTWMNPASPARLKSPTLTLGGQRGYFGDMLGQGLAVVPVGFGVLTAGISTYSTGLLNLTTYNGEERQVTGQRDTLGIFGFSRSISPGMDLGISVKILKTTLFDEATASTTAVDIGTQFRIIKALKAGIAIRNIGSQLQYAEDSISLPSTVCVGFAYGLKFRGLGHASARQDTLIFLADVERPATDTGTPVWRGGLEYQWRRALALRFGAKTGPREELDSYAVGFGISISKFRLDYGMQIGRTAFDKPQTISLTVGF